MKTSTALILLASMGVAYYFVSRPVPKVDGPIDTAEKIADAALGGVKSAANTVGNVAVKIASAINDSPVGWAGRQVVGAAQFSNKVVGKVTDAIDWITPW